MRKILSTMLILVTGSFYLLGIIGCEGEQGPAGPPGPSGTTEDAGYLGDSENTCGHCHAAAVEGWMHTNHAEAYGSLIDDDNHQNNLYCLQCHTTGFDDEYDHDQNLLSAGEDLDGYDDNPRSAVQGVQCEACHGYMGPDVLDHAPEVMSPLRGDACDKCHTQNEEYATSGHGMVIENLGGYEEFLGEHYASSGSCQGCHTSEGFMTLWDDDWAARGVPDEPWQVTCATCHDVHMASTDDNPAYLRGLEAVTLEYGTADNPDEFEIEDWGAGQLCVQCHHARRDLADITEQIEEGDDHPGPHHSNQADMVVGVGCWEIEGYEYDREPDHTPSLLADMCVQCHLYSIPHGETDGPLYGHSFAPDVRACQQCHAGATDFNIDGKRDEIAGLLDDLLALLPNDGEEPLFDAESTTREQREAAYGWYFVHNEASYGVHNYEYAKSILENAIDYMND